MEQLLAFLSVPAIAASREVEAETRLPVFKLRPWHRRDRLDARPVAWSLRNRPQDWEWEMEGYTIRHKPSKHIFWVASGYGFYRLYAADCSCTSTRGRFQRFQQGMFGRAFKSWRRNNAAATYDPAHFASHFVR